MISPGGLVATLFNASVVVSAAVDTFFGYVSLLLNGETLPSFIADASTNSLAITPVGAVRNDAKSPFSGVQGSGFFNGTTDYLTSPANTALALGTGDFTVETWVYFNSVAGTYIPFIQGATIGAAASDIWFMAVTGGALRFMTHNSGGYNASTPWTPATGQWYHIAATRTSGTTQLYINGTAGTMTGATSGNNYVLNQSGLAIGAITTPYYFSGYLSNTRLVKGTAVYTGAFTPSTTSLTAVANTTLLTLQNPTPATNKTFIDASVNNAVITPSGNPAQGTFSPFSQSGWSGQFSGTTYATAPIGSTPAIGSGANYTIELWINVQAYASSYSYIVSSGQGANGYSIFVSSAGVLMCQANNTQVAPAAAYGIVSTQVVSLNTWHHVAMVRNNGIVRLYYDGVSIGGTYADVTPIASSITYMGGPSSALANASFSHIGYTSNFRVVSGTAVYTANFTPSSSPLPAIAGTSLLTLQNNYLKDGSANGYAITNTGVTVQAVSPFEPSVSWTALTNGGSIYFAGAAATDFLTIPSSSALNLSTGSWTIEGFVYPNASSGYRTVISKRTGGTADWEVGMDTTAGALYFYAAAVKVSSTVIPNNQWTHFAVTYDGTTLRMFQNGVITYTLATAQPAGYNAASGVIVGCTGNSQYFTGYLSNLHVVKGTAVYTSAFTPPTAPLTAITNTQLLLSGTNTAMIDYAGKNDIQSLASAQVTQSVKKYGTGSMKFTGVATDYITMPIGNALNLGTGNFTIECWFQQIAHPATQPCIFSNYTSYTAGALGLFAGHTSSSTTKYQLSYNGVTFPTSIVSTTSIAAAGTWQHLAVVRAGNVLSLYVDGVPNGSVAVASTVSFTGVGSNFYIGQAGDILGTGYLNGYIDDFRVTKGIARYNGGFAVPTQAYGDNSTSDPYFNSVSLLMHADGASSYTANVYNNNTVIDSSNNALTLTRVGTPTQGTFSPFEQNGWSGYFAGDQSYTSTASNAVFGFGTGAFTLEAWIYPTTAAGNGPGTVFELRPSAIASPYTVRINASRQIMFYDGTDTPFTSQTVTLNAWNHVAWVKSGTTVTGYINGLVAGTVTSTVSGGASLPCVIGANHTAGYSFSGYISNARIVKGVAVYTGAFTPPTSPLTATQSASTNIAAITGTQTSLLTLQDGRFKDNSANALTVTGNTTLAAVPFSPFNTAPTYSAATNTGSIYFNGSTDCYTLPATNQFAFGTGDFTVELWVYLTAAPTYQNIFTTGAGSTNNINCYMNGLSPIFYYYATTVVAGPAVALNTWNHIAYVRYNTTFRIYTNGVSTTSQVYGDSLANVGPIRIGNEQGGTQPVFGYLSNMRIVKGTCLYTSNFVPPTSPLSVIANTSLLVSAVNQSAGIIDSTGRNDVVTVGSAATQTAVVKYGTGALKFNTSTDWLIVPPTNQVAFGTGDFTVECWINQISGANNGIIQIGASNFPGTAGLALALVGNKVQLYSLGGNPLSTGTTISNGTWFHLAVVRLSGVTKLYINGTLDTTIGTAGSIADVNNYTGTYCVVGAYYSTGYGFNGYIDDVRITKGVARYTGNFTAPTAALPNSSATDAYFNYTSLLLQGDIQSATVKAVKNNSFIDSSANALAVTPSGAPTQGTFTPFSNNNWSGYFNGSTDYITQATLALGSGDFTVEGWWNFPSWTLTPLFTQGSTDTSTSILVNLQANGSIQVYSVSAIFVTSAAIVPLNRWVHIALVKSGNVLTLYIDGASANSGTRSISLTSLPFQINRGYGGVTAGGAYSVSNFRVVASALYTAAFTPSTAPLTAISSTSLLTLQSNRFKDNSANNFALTATGAPSVRTFSPFPVATYSTATNSGSMYFNGSTDWLTAPASTNWIFAGDYTIEAWVYPTAGTSAAYQQICGTGGAGSNDQLGYTVGSGNAAILWNYVGAGNINLTSTATILVNTWTHIAVARSGTTLKAFVNGAQVYSGTQSGSIGQNLTMYVGKRSANDDFVTGHISNLHIVNGTAVYTAAFTPSTTPLTAIANTKLLLGATNGAMVDNAGNADLVLVGSAQAGNNAKFGNTSLMLNGTTDYATVTNSRAIGTSDFTIEAWIYYAAGSTAREIYSCRASSSTGLATSGSLYLNTTNGLGWFTTGVVISSPSAVPSGVWTHIALSRIGTTMRMFIDGSVVSVATNSDNLTSAIATIGANADGTEKFAGYIDDLRVTVGVGRYVSNFTPPTAAFYTR